MGVMPIGGELKLAKAGVSNLARASQSFQSALTASQAPRPRPVNLPQLKHFSPPPDPGNGTTVIPARDADPKQVAAWWGGLSQTTRDGLIRDHHAELGMLRGLPAEDADNVNRLRLNEDVSNLRGELHDLEFSIGGRQSVGVPIPHEDRERQERLKTELGNAEKMQDQMRRLDDDVLKTGAPKPYLLTYSYQNEGRFAVALGNPDTARNTAVVVPGSGHDVKHEGGPFPTVGEGRRVYDQMNVEDQNPSSQPTNENAVIVWLGADMPDDTASAINPTYADEEHGGRLLHDDVAGYQAAIAQDGGGPGHMTVIAHSYGTYMTSKAVGLGMKVDDLVLVGSPGLGNSVDSADDLGGARVWVGATDDDFVAHSGWFGPVPSSSQFGANVFATDGSEGHGHYLDEGSLSLRNIGRIATGEDRYVVLRRPG